MLVILSSSKRKIRVVILILYFDDIAGTRMEVDRIDLEKCSLFEEDTSEWRNRIHVADSNIVWTRL